jgi:hypothetical protein
MRDVAPRRSSRVYNGRTLSETGQESATETVAGRYRIEAELGKGGMGAVYRATDLRTGGTVALKRMFSRKRKTSRRSVLRFQREFHTLTSLAHPRIIRAFDFGVDEVGPYYTMELLGGVDLRDVIRDRGKLPPEEACRLLRDMASGLAALHARGLIHRDLSPRNVRVIDGRATLFDFGVLVNTGWVGDIAGTPAYTAPEMIRGIPVDGRADLYSLGVLGYAMLTGRRPYDARSMKELESCWAAPVVPPSSIAPVPEALEDLVLDLLCLEPLGRPATAAVLIDRLTSIGELEPAPELAVTPGFTESAAMVGRDAELATLRALFSEARGGSARGDIGRSAPARGGAAPLPSARAFVVEAVSGAGKTRLLQELAIRTKLQGALTLRVSCEDSEGGPLGVLAALVDEALAVAPDQAKQASKQEAPLLGRVFRSVRQAHPDAPVEEELGDAAEDRMRLQAAVVRFVRALASERPVVILVDDVQRCDEASAAGLAGLARAEVPGLLVGFARRLGEQVRAPVPVASLSSLEPQLQLGGLDVDGTRGLLKTIFGEVAHLDRLARWMHHATDGSPLYCTELTRHLVESNAIRYDDGTWILPDEITQTAMPDGLAAALRKRVEGLSDRARAVGEVLAVYGADVALGRLMRLVLDQDGERPPTEAGLEEEAVFNALDELVQQGVLADTGDRVRFRHDSVREALLAAIAPDRRRQLHRHVGRVLLEASTDEQPEAEAEVGWHLYHGGDEERGGAMLERAGRRLFQAQAMADCIPPLATALEVHERHGAPDPVVGELSYMLLVAGWQADREVGSRHIERPLDIYARLSGVGTAARLRRWVGLRLAFVLGLLWATLRWLFRRGRARGPNPVRALAYFAIALGYATAIAYAGNQKERVRGLVSRAAPFAAFKGTTAFSAYLMLHALTDVLEGRLQSAGDRLTEAIRLIERPFLNPLGQTERKLTAASGRAVRVLVDVNQFDPRLYDDLDALDRSGFASYRHTADTLRVVHLRYRGEEARARELEATLEPTSLQLNSWSVDLSRLLFAHPAYALTHDVEGLKRCLDALRRRVAEGMELQDRVDVTCAELHRERGEFGSALAILERVLERLDLDDHLMRQFAASAAAQAALESYRYELAVRHAALGLDDGSNPAFRLLLPWLRCQRVLGLAEDALGRSEQAAARLDRAIEVAESRDCPVLAGELHEARARVAFAVKDRLRFEVHRAKCAAWLRPTANPGLIAVVERLVELDRLDRDASLPAPDPRRRRPGASTETTGASASVTETTGEGDSDPDVVVTASQILEPPTATSPWNLGLSTTRPPPDADTEQDDEDGDKTAAASPRAIEETEDKTAAASPRAIEDAQDQTAASSPHALARDAKDKP